MYKFAFVIERVHVCDFLSPPIGILSTQIYHFTTQTDPL